MRPRGDGKGTGASAKLNTFDVTSLVVGSIIGADVYVATAIGARLIGPASLLAWVLAGGMAMVIALSFSYCVMILPKVGGPYAYVKAVAGPFPGFIVGWGLLLAEWFSLAVFPVAFTQYFVSLDPGIDDLGKAPPEGRIHRDHLDDEPGRDQGRGASERRLDGRQVVAAPLDRPRRTRVRGSSAGPVRRELRPVLHRRCVRVRPGARPHLLGV